MNPHDLVAMCDDAEREGGDGVSLVLRRERLPRGENVRLCGWGGPYCDEIMLIREAEPGYDIVAYFNAAKVRAFIKRELARREATDAHRA